MWNRPAPYIDDSDDSATRPFSSAETPAQQPARVRSSLRRALRVLIPTVVAGAGLVGLAAAALGDHGPRIRAAPTPPPRTATPAATPPPRPPSELPVPRPC